MFVCLKTKTTIPLQFRFQHKETVCDARVLIFPDLTLVNACVFILTGLIYLSTLTGQNEPERRARKVPGLNSPVYLFCIVFRHYLTECCNSVEANDVLGISLKIVLFKFEMWLKNFKELIAHEMSIFI